MHARRLSECTTELSHVNVLADETQLMILDAKKIIIFLFPRGHGIESYNDYIRRAGPAPLRNKFFLDKRLGNKIQIKIFLFETFSL